MQPPITTTASYSSSSSCFQDFDFAIGSSLDDKPEPPLAELEGPAGLGLCSSGLGDFLIFICIEEDESFIKLLDPILAR